jgi:hypothetical protein
MMMIPMIKDFELIGNILNENSKKIGCLEKAEFIIIISNL